MKTHGFEQFSAKLTQFFEVEYNQPMALILGNENKGIDKNYLPFVDKIIYIPSFGKAESLNLASAGAILISEVALRKLVTRNSGKIES